MKSLRLLLFATLLGMLGGLSAPSWADDTDLYLKQAATVVDPTARPNILFILDRSGSMGQKDYDENGDVIVEKDENGDVMYNFKGQPIQTRLDKLQNALLTMLDTVEQVNVGFMTFTSTNGKFNIPVEFPINYIDKPTDLIVGEAGSGVVDVQITSADDDAEEGVISKKVYLNDEILETTYASAYSAPGALEITKIYQIASSGDNAMELIADAGWQHGDAYTVQQARYLGGNKVAGSGKEVDTVTALRFPNIDIPKDAEITSAKIIFTRHDDDSDASGTPLDLVIQGVTDPISFPEKQRPNNLPAFMISHSADGWSQTTSATTSWEVPEWPNTGEYYSNDDTTTPDISSIIQEFVSDADWQGDGSEPIGFFIVNAAHFSNLSSLYTGQVDTSTLVTTGRPYANTFDSSGEYAPILSITYQLSAEDTDDSVAKLYSRRISHEADNATEMLDTAGDYDKGTVWYDSLSLGLNGECDEKKRNGDCEDYDPTITALRFPNVPIPKNANIVSAYVEFTRSDKTEALRSGDDTSTNAYRIEISAEDSSNPTAFHGSVKVDHMVTYDISARSLITEKVIWDISAAENEALDVGSKFVTPNIASVVKAVTKRDDWNKVDNALTLTFSLGGAEGTYPGQTMFYAYGQDGGAGRSARLVLTWTEKTTAATSTEEEADVRDEEDQIVGLRFQDVRVPKGATVTDAYLIVQNKQANTSQVKLKVYAENTDNSKAFTSITGNLSSRAVTSGITWDITEKWEEDGVYQSPDLTDIIKAVVDRTDWCGGNSLTLLLKSNYTSTGDVTDKLRQIKAFDFNSSDAPRLHIEYDAQEAAENSSQRCMNETYYGRVTRGGDDAEETVIRSGSSDSTVFIDSDILEMTTTGSGSSETKRVLGFFFRGVPINRNTQITAAQLMLTGRGTPVNETDAAAALSSVNWQVYAEYTPNAEEFNSGQPKNLTRRASTSTVAWNIATDKGWSADSTYSSPDIASIIQEVVSQGSWDAGNNMALFIKGDGLRLATGYEYNPAQAARLMVQVKGTLYESEEAYVDSSYSTTVRERLKQLTKAIQPGGGTPLVDAFYEATSYMMGWKIVHGKSRYYESKNRVSHIASYDANGATHVMPDGCSAAGLSADACKGEYIDDSNGTPTYIKPELKNPECQGNHIVFLTDGAANGPTKNKSEIIALSGGSSCATSFNTYARDPATGKTLSEIQRDYDADISGSYLPNGEICGEEIVKYLHENGENVKVHTITMAMAVPTYDKYGNYDETASIENIYAEQYMKHWASDSVGGGNYYSAKSATDLLEAFQTIIAGAITESTSFAAPTLSVNVFNNLFHNNEVYFSLFKPSEHLRWYGNIKKYQIATTGTVGDILDAYEKSAVSDAGYIADSSTSIWTKDTKHDPDGAAVLKGGAGLQLMLQGHTGRNIFTCNKDACSATGMQNIDISNADLTNTSLGDSSASYKRENLINWVRGQAVNLPPEEEGHEGDQRWPLFDILHSSPVAITYGNNEDTAKSRLFFGTNGGTIHMLDGDTGQEVWAFLPKEMLSIQTKLMVNDKIGSRVYGVDATPQIWLKDKNRNGKFDSSDEARMFIGMRRGGCNVYGFDITNVNQSPYRPSLMWTIKGGGCVGNTATSGYQQLAQTWSAPKITNVVVEGDVKTVLLFGGGYNRSSDESSTGIRSDVSVVGNAIFMADALTGKCIWGASSSTSLVDGCTYSLSIPGMTAAIPSDLALIDINGDNNTDRIYVGDVDGQVWRIDFGSNLNSTNAGIGGMLADINSPEGTRTFFYPPDVLRVEDNRYAAEDPNYDYVVMVSGTRPTPLSKANANQIYAFRDRAIKGLHTLAVNGVLNVEQCQQGPDNTSGSSDPDFCTIVPSKNMYDATDNVLQQGSGDESSQEEIDNTVSIEIEKLRDSKGWYVDLEQSAGEKGLASPLILDYKVIFTTYLPDAGEQETTSTCGGSLSEGQSRLYIMHLFTAGAAFDSGDDGITTDDRYTTIRDGMTSEASPVYLEDAGGQGSSTHIITNDLDTASKNFGKETSECASSYCSEPEETECDPTALKCNSLQGGYWMQE